MTVGPFVERSSLPAQDAEALPNLPLEFKHVLMSTSSPEAYSVCARVCPCFDLYVCSGVPPTTTQAIKEGTLHYLSLSFSPYDDTHLYQICPSFDKQEIPR